MASGLTNKDDFFAMTISKGIITSTANKVSAFPVTTLKDFASFNWETKMPANLSSKWVVQNNGVTISIPLGISQTKNRVYYGMFGQFVDDPTILPAVLNMGFSYTEDYGKTWSEPQKTSIKLFQDFAQSYGAIKDSISLFRSGTHKGFAAFDNGNVSFITDIEFKTTQNQWVDMIIEVYYENNTWGIRPISNTIGSQYVIYVLNQNNQLSAQLNPSSSEIQLSKTADNQYYIAKWLEGSYYPSKLSNNQDIFLSKSQIKVAKRKAGSTEWIVENLTEGGQNFDRYYFLPSVLPNDLQNIPIFCLKSVTLGSEKSFADSNFTAQRADVLNFLCTSKFSFDDNTNIDLPNIQSSTTSINFDTSLVKSKKELSFTISNTGKGNLILNSMKINNDQKGVFSLKDNFSSDTIKPNNSKEFTIIFTPKDLENYSSVLNIISNDNKNSELEINISGLGILPMIWINNATFPATNFAHSCKFLGQPDKQQTVAWADDIVIPAGKTWKIDTIGFTVSNQVKVADSYQFTIFGDLNGLPNSKDIKFSKTIPSNNLPLVGQIGNVFANIKDSNLELKEGKYWLSFYGNHNNGKLLATNPGFNEMTYWCCEQVVSGFKGTSSSVVVDSAGLFTKNIPTKWSLANYNASLPIINMSFSIFGKEMKTTNVNDIDFVNGKILAFPNPSNEKISFSINSIQTGYSVEIFNSLGEVVDIININSNSIDLDISKYTSGTYYFQLIGSNNKIIETGKFIKLNK